MQQQQKMATGALTLVALLSVVVGVLVMLVCALFMFSSKQIDVMGAGLGIVAGAILFTGGLICITILTVRSGATEMNR